MTEPVFASEKTPTVPAGTIIGITAGALAPWIQWNWEMIRQWKLLEMTPEVSSTVGLLALAVLATVHRYSVKSADRADD